MVAVTFPDGACREYPQGITGFEIAKGISPSLAKRTVAMALDGVVVDLADQIEQDAKIEFVSRDDPRALELIRHDAAHVLAEAVQDELGTVEPGPDRGVQQAGFVVLGTAFMPAVLVEIGFGSNRADAAFMTDSRDQTKLAGAIADAAVNYLNAYWAGISGVADRTSGGNP